MKKPTIRELSNELKSLGFRLQWASAAGNGNHRKLTRQYVLDAACGQVFVRLEPKGVFAGHHVTRWHLTHNGPGCYSGDIVPTHFSTMSLMRKLIVRELRCLAVLQDGEQASKYGGLTVAAIRENSPL